MMAIAFLFVRMLGDCFKSRQRLGVEILVLRHQLNVLQQRATPSVCTENLARIELVMESRHACGGGTGGRLQVEVAA
jgi:hypothetical protein